MDNSQELIEHWTIVEDAVEAKEVEIPHNNVTRTKRKWM